MHTDTMLQCSHRRLTKDADDVSHYRRATTQILAQITILCAIIECESEGKKMKRVTIVCIILITLTCHCDSRARWLRAQILHTFPHNWHIIYAALCIQQSTPAKCLNKNYYSLNFALFDSSSHRCQVYLTLEINQLHNFHIIIKFHEYWWTIPFTLRPYYCWPSLANANGRDQ